MPSQVRKCHSCAQEKDILEACADLEDWHLEKILGPGFEAVTAETYEKNRTVKKAVRKAVFGECLDKESTYITKSKTLDRRGEHMGKGGGECIPPAGQKTSPPLPCSTKLVPIST